MPWSLRGFERKERAYNMLGVNMDVKAGLPMIALAFYTDSYALLPYQC